MQQVEECSCAMLADLLARVRQLLGERALRIQSSKVESELADAGCKRAEGGERKLKLQVEGYMIQVKSYHVAYMLII